MNSSLTSTPIRTCPTAGGYEEGVPTEDAAQVGPSRVWIIHLPAIGVVEDIREIPPNQDLS